MNNFSDVAISAPKYTGSTDALPTTFDALRIKTIKFSGEEIGVTEKGTLEVRVVEEEDTPKDGGVRGWLTVLGVFFIQFTGFGYSNAFGVYQDFYAQSFLSSSSSSKISWVGSVQVFFLMSSGIISGRLFDKGYFYHLVGFGSFLMVFSIFMLSLAKPEQFYQVFLAQGLGVGIGAGILFVPSLAVVSQHFRTPTKRTLALGLAGSGSSLGGVLHPIMLNNLFQGPTGFANSVRASGGLLAGLLLLSMCLMRTNYPPRGNGAGNKTIGLGTAIKEFSKDSAYVFMVIGMFLLPIGFIFMLFFIQVFSGSHDLSTTFSFYSLPIMNAGALIGRVVPGIVSRKVGVSNMLIITSGACAILIFGLLGVPNHNTGGVAAFSSLYGFFLGGFLAVQPPMLAMLARNPREIGARTGIGYTAQGLGSLVGAPVAGALLTADFIWWRPLVFSGVFCASGCAIFIVVRMILGRRNDSASWIL
ncbi:hypothetical protein M0805_005870 [Coniferiporia weirii]|nr:hypothetical protein M0805_005870 [Coniferiporia weirii]